MADRNWETRDRWHEMADCPFCGAKAEDFTISVSYSENLSGILKDFMGECSDCGAMGPTYLTEKNAFNAWNRRALITEQESDR